MKKLSIFIFLFAFILLPIVSAWSDNFNVNLTAYWTFNESSGTTAYDSLGIYNITNMDNVHKANGKVNGSYGTGASHYNATGIPFQETTVNIWLRRANSPATFNDLLIIGSRQYGTAVCNNACFQVIGASAGFFDVYINGFPRYRISAIHDQWYMLTFTGNSTGVYTYLDGSLVNTTFFARNTTDSKSIDFGNEYNGVASTGWDADEFGIWNRVLNASEVSQLYNSGVGTTYQSNSPPITIADIEVELISPINETNTTELTLSFNATVIPSNLTLTNATLFIWYENTTELVQNTTSLSGNVTSQAYFTQTLPIGSFYYNVLGCGYNIENSSDIQCSFAPSNYSLSTYEILLRDGSVDVTLISPINETNTTELTLSFNATVIPNNITLTNASLIVKYLNNSIYLSSDISLSGNVTTNAEFSETLEIGEFYYNILGCGLNIDNSSETVCSFADSDFYINIYEVTPEPETSPTYQSTPIYQVMDSGGAGLGRFFNNLTNVLPFLLLGLLVVSIVILIGMSIMNIFKPSPFMTWRR
jgi:hypothetical protein